MDKIGKNLKSYRNVIINNSIIGDNVTLADDVYLSESTLGNHCRIERRGMVFNSELGDYSYTGYNTIVKYANIGKFCSVSWNVSIGGANHDYGKASTHPFYFKNKYCFTEKQENYTSFNKPLNIGNDVWIGSNVIILRGCTIGNGAVIGGVA